jgi:hypothetical protein
VFLFPIKILPYSLRVAFKNFGPPYTLSSKEPGRCVCPVGLYLPTVVIESGWSESRPRLHNDVNLWLKGGAGAIKIVLLFKWSKSTSGQVRGHVKVHNLDPAGNVNLLQTEVIIISLALRDVKHIKSMADKTRQYSQYQTLQL